MRGGFGAAGALLAGGLPDDEARAPLEDAPAAAPFAPSLPAFSFLPRLNMAKSMRKPYTRLSQHLVTVKSTSRQQGQVEQQAQGYTRGWIVRLRGGM